MLNKLQLEDIRPGSYILTRNHNDKYELFIVRSIYPRAGLPGRLKWVVENRKGQIRPLSKCFPIPLTHPIVTFCISECYHWHYPAKKDETRIDIAFYDKDTRLTFNKEEAHLHLLQNAYRSSFRKNLQISTSIKSEIKYL